MDRIEVAAFAKVNFILDMVGLRADGYHELESIMQAIELHDDVAVEWDEDLPSKGKGFREETYPAANGSGIHDAKTGVPNGCGNAAAMTESKEGSCSVSASNALCSQAADHRDHKDFRIILKPGKPYLPADERNLAYKAALKMREAFRPDACGTVRISVTKRIPVAAGLAGGSSNGAAVCTALGKLWNIPMEDWLPVAATLGADVPFSAWAQNGRTAAFARGTGTELTAIEPLDCQLVLLNPGYPVSTKEVYKAFDASPKGLAFATAEQSDALVPASGTYADNPALAAGPYSKGRCTQEAAADSKHSANAQCGEANSEQCHSTQSCDVNSEHSRSRLEAASNSNLNPCGQSSAANSTTNRCRHWIAARTLNEKLQFLNNDLQPVTLALRPQLQKVFDELRSLQPAPLAVQLSGSGPTVYAVYPPDAEIPEDRQTFRTLL